MKDIEGYERIYAIYPDGRVYSYPRSWKTGVGTVPKHSGLFLKPYNAGGYPAVGLSKNGVVKRHLVHRLVAETFLPNPSHLPHVNHIDGNKNNPSLINLEWVTASQNMRHASREGLLLRGEQCHMSKLSPEDVCAVRTRANAGEKQADLAREYLVSPSTISNIVSGRSWRHLTW